MHVGLPLISLGSATGTGKLALFVWKTYGGQGVDIKQRGKWLLARFTEGNRTLAPQAILQQPLYHCAHFIFNEEFVMGLSRR